MYKKDFLEQKYCEINQLKNLLQTYPKEYCETIIKVMEKVFDEISEYLNKESNKIKEVTKIDSIESKVNGLDKKIEDLGNKIIGNENINYPTISLIERNRNPFLLQKWTEQIKKQVQPHVNEYIHEFNNPETKGFPFHSQ